VCAMIKWHEIKSYLAGIFQLATKQPQQPVEKAKIDITVGGLHSAMFPDREGLTSEIKKAEILQHIAICKNKLTALVGLMVKDNASLAIFEKLESDINNSIGGVLISFDKDTLSLLAQNAHNIKAALAISIRTQPSNITEVTIDNDTIQFPSSGNLNFLPPLPKGQMVVFDNLASWAKQSVTESPNPSQRPFPG
jgi:hypothetical protein